MMDTLLIEDPASGSSARIVPGLGFNCYEFRAMVDSRPVDVLYSVPEFATAGGRPSGNGIPLLFPYPNRVRAGRFEWEGKTYRLPTPQPGANAIHGFCHDRAWRVVEQSESSATGQFQLSVDAPDRREAWPADFILEVRYTVSGAALRSQIRVVNPDTKPLPWGFGTHAYFRVPLSPGSDSAHCLLQAPASQQWELDPLLLPTGRRVPVPADKDLRDGQYFDVVKLDDVLTGVELTGGRFECIVMDEKAGLEVVQTCDGVFREVVAFTPPHRQAVCLEPYTCVTDAINLQQQGIDAGLRTLEPGGEFTTWIEISASLVIA